MIGKGSRRFLRQDDGTAAIEFALIAPVILLLFVAMVNLGFRFLEESRINQVARETAEASMFTQDMNVLRQTMANAIADLGPSISGVPYTGTVTRLCACPGSADIPDCSITQAATCPSTGGPWSIVIEVTTNMNYRPLIPLTPIFSTEEALQSTLRIQVR